LGELLTAMSAKLPVGKIGFSQTVFALSQEVPYDYGVTNQLLDEVDLPFNTSSMRNVYSPDVSTARELVTDRLAAALKKDPYTFRRELAKDDRTGPSSTRWPRKEAGAARCPPVRRRASRSTRSTRASTPASWRSTAVPRR
jgi:hypothetical protein